MTPQYGRNKLADFGREQEKRANAGARRYQRNLFEGSESKSIVKHIDSGIIKSRNAMVSGKYPTSDKVIKDISENELKGVKFSHPILYNGRIRSQGKTTAQISPLGIVKIKSIEIGKQVVNSRECIIDTMLHEELEARIMLRAKNSKFYSKLNEASDKERHEYINKIIKRFFSGKGWDYEATKRLV